MLDFSFISPDDRGRIAAPGHIRPRVVLTAVGGSDLAGRRQRVNSGTSADPVPAQMTRLLAALAETHDQADFIRLFEYYAPRIKTYLRRLGADDATAEELAQEAMLTVWRKAGFFDPAKASAGTWIFAIARNLRIDRLRRERRPELDPDDPALVPDPETPPDDALAAGQRERTIRAAVATLPPEQAEVIALSFYEDTPHSEISTRLGIPLGTVKSRLRLAMNRIRAALGDGPTPMEDLR